MTSTRTQRRALVAISASTILSGAAQAMAPAPTLALLHVGDDAAARQLFGTIGMFMVVSGGTLGQELMRHPGDPSPVVVGWAAAQKLGAAGAVGLGVARGVFSPIALCVAGFDALSGLLALRYLRRVREGR